MSATLQALRAAGMLSPLDEHFARAMGRISGEQRPEVLLAAALASRHVSNGHVCVELSRLVTGPPLVNEAGEPCDTLGWPNLDRWIAALRASELVGDGRGMTPLVLDDAGRLYLRRYWQHEQRLAAALSRRAVDADVSIDATWLRPALDRLFPRDRALPDAEPDWQRVAAVLALQRRFCVISGGPGTGKTFTVVKLLALLIEHAAQRRERPPRVTLLAPTGKAAARLSESIQRAKTGLDCSDDVKRKIPDEAATIHRCLSPIGGSATRFRYHAENPLFTDLVLVDEASMVDLALMTRLVEAVPAHARLILLGDQDQLASVEAGAVLGDICNTGAPRHYSRTLIEAVTTCSGERLPQAPDAPSVTGIWDCIVQLTRSYRYEAHSGIGVLARAINTGDSAAALAILDSVEYPGVALVEPSADGALSDTLRRAAVRGFSPYLAASRTWNDAATQSCPEPGRRGGADPPNSRRPQVLTACDPAEQLRLLERFRVLCAHRRGRDGVEVVNRLVEAALSEAEVLRLDTGAYVGRPVMVTRNDYQLELFNGDVGVILDDTARGCGKVVAFPAAGGGVRTLSPARLPPHETVFAMSVHKSQGSEFDEVAVVLPPRISAVLSRELLYTAVTRARHAVTIHASREMIAHAAAHRLERASGLRELLWT